MLELLYDALHADVGIRVATEEPTQLREKLYRERKKDPDLRVLSIIQSPLNPTGELWIINKEKIRHAQQAQK